MHSSFNSTIHAITKRTAIITISQTHTAMYSSFNNTQIMLSPHSPLNHATVRSTFNYFLMCLLNHNWSVLVSKPGAHRQVLLPAMSIYLPQNWSFLVSKPGAHRQVLLPDMFNYHRTGLSWSQSQVHTDRCCCQQCLLTTELVFPGLKARCTLTGVVASNFYLPQNWSFLVSKSGAH